MVANYLFQIEPTHLSLLRIDNINNLILWFNNILFFRKLILFTYCKFDFDATNLQYIIFSFKLDEASQPKGGWPPSLAKEPRSK